MVESENLQELEIYKLPSVSPGSWQSLEPTLSILADSYFHMLIRDITDQNEAAAKPQSAYAMFFREQQHAIKTREPSLTFGEISRKVSALWNALSDRDKKKYKAIKDKSRRIQMSQAVGKKLATLSTISKR